MCTGSIHVVANVRIPFFLSLNSLPLWGCFCAYMVCFLNLFIHQWMNSHVLVIVGNAAENMEVKLSLSGSNFISFRYTPRSRIAGSCGSSIFNLSRNLHIVFYCSCTNSAQGLPSHLLQHLSLILIVTVILTDVRWYLIVGWICIFLKVSNAELFFSCTCWSYVYLLWKNVFSDSLPVLFYFTFLLLNCMSPSYILDVVAAS